MDDAAPRRDGTRRDATRRDARRDRSRRDRPREIFSNASLASVRLATERTDGRVVVVVVETIFEQTRKRGAAVRPSESPSDRRSSSIETRSDALSPATRRAREIKTATNGNGDFSRVRVRDLRRRGDGAAGS